MNQFKQLIIALACMISVSLSAQDTEDPTNSVPHIIEGIKFHEEGKYQSAVKAFNKVHRNDTNYSLALYEKSLSLLEAEKFEQCISACKEGLELESENENYFFVTYGTALSNSDRYEEAMTVFNQAIEKFPRSSTLKYNKAVVQLKNKKYNDGLNTLYKTLEENPYHANSHLLLANYCNDQEYETKAILSYAMFLFVSSNDRTGYSWLREIDGYCSGSMVGENEYGSEDFENEAFEELDELVNNKIAITDRYKTPSKYSFAFIKQMHLIMESIQDIKPDKNDFWSSFYVPMFNEISSNNMFAEMSYYMLRSGESYNTDIQKTTEKNRSKINSFVQWYLETFVDVYGMHEVDGEEVEYHYANGDLIGIGDYNTKTKEQNGDWVLFHSSGVIASEGKFIRGERNGKWNFYYRNGELESTYIYKDGKANGPFQEYSLKGVLIKEGTYKDNLYNGTLTEYYVTGGKSSETDYEEGIYNGKLIYYHKNGVKSTEASTEDGYIEGTVYRYNVLGEKSSSMEFEKGTRNGKSTDWYSSGKVSGEYIYVDDKLNGKIVEYYENGQKSSEEEYKNGQLVGKSTSYFKNGVVSSTSEFDETGKENGFFIEYYPSGKIYSKLTYKKGNLMAYAYFSEDQEVLKEGKAKGKNLDYVRVDSARYDNVVGSYVKGKQTGKWEYKGPLGAPYRTNNFKNGELEGDQIVYHINGNTSIEFNCVDGEYQGWYYRYSDANPRIKTREGYYIDDNAEGEFITKNDMGDITELEYFRNNQIEGWQQYFSAKGVLVREAFYEKGNYLGNIMYDSKGENPERAWLDNGNGHLILKYPSGKTRFDGEYKNGTADGPFIWYYPNGELETKGTYVNGKRHGDWIYYHENGELQKKLSYKLGNLSGKYETYFEDGKIQITGTYLNDELEGKYTRYYNNGNVRYESNYNDGNRHGNMKSYVPTGELAIIKRYVDDIFVAYTYEKPDGSMADEIELDEGANDIEAYFKNGKKSLVASTENGYFHGDFTYYYPSGSIYKSITYNKGNVEGNVKAKQENGTLIYDYNYKYDEFHGDCVDYYENGKIKCQLNYYNGSLEGESTYYTTEGRAKKRTYFNNIFYTGEF